MIKIAICDDKPATVNGLQEYLIRYFNRKSMKVMIELHLNPGDLFDAMMIQPYDIVFMDLVFDSSENDGILWCQRINKHYPKTLVLILTAFESRFKEGYVARAYRFMTKPLVWQEVHDNLDACLNELNISQTIQIYPHGIELSIALRDILYLEANSGGSILYLNDSQYYCSESLLYWEQTLPAALFFRCHKKYLVNLGHIHQLEHHTISLLRGTKLPVSRRKWTELREAYIRYDISR